MLIATSVVRGSRQGDSHGGVYLIDFARQSVEQKVDWNTCDIDFQGRGWDRGLRGIAFDGDDVYIAASDELFVYGPDFSPRGSYRSPYLKHAHEICRYERNLFVTSTGFNSVLAFNLDDKRFAWGLFISDGTGGFDAAVFDPAAPSGPPAGNVHHLNNVYCDTRGLYVSGRGTRMLLRFDGRALRPVASLPDGVHNAMPYHDGVLFNDTENDVIRYATPADDIALRVPAYDPDELTHTDFDDTALARQGFGRGLCVLGDRLVAAGSSPSTVALYDFGRRKRCAYVNLTMDIRNAIHGLEVWPF